MIVPVGGALLASITGSVTVSFNPRASVTVSLGTYWAGVVYVCCATGCVDVTPSPKSHRYVIASPSGSELADASNVTTSGATPLVGSTVYSAAGARLPAPTNSNLYTLLSEAVE